VTTLGDAGSHRTFSILRATSFLSKTSNQFSSLFVSSHVTLPFQALSDVPSEMTADIFSKPDVDIIGISKELCLLVEDGARRVRV
jgi:hypothetical protein